MHLHLNQPDRLLFLANPYQLPLSNAATSNSNAATPKPYLACSAKQRSAQSTVSKSPRRAVELWTSQPTDTGIITLNFRLGCVALITIRGHPEHAPAGNRRAVRLGAQPAYARLILACPAKRGLELGGEFHPPGEPARRGKLPYFAWW